MGKRKQREVAAAAVDGHLEEQHGPEGSHLEEQRGPEGSPAAQATAADEPHDLEAADGPGSDGSSEDDEAEQQQQPQQPAEAARPKPGKPAPVLPWMKVPITIAAADGVLLEDVRGMDPRLRAALGGARPVACHLQQLLQQQQGEEEEEDAPLLFLGFRV